MPRKHVSHSYFKLLYALEDSPPIWALTELFIAHNDVIRKQFDINTYQRQESASAHTGISYVT